jgi:hypothetical protein
VRCDGWWCHGGRDEAGRGRGRPRRADQLKDFALDPAQDLVALLEHRPSAGLIVSSTSLLGASAGADIRMQRPFVRNTVPYGTHCGPLRWLPPNSSPVLIYCKRIIDSIA